MPKNIVLKVSKPQEFHISLNINRPKVTERTTSFVSILSTKPRILKIYSFHYQSVDTYPGVGKPIFHGFTMELEGTAIGKADLIITTEMTVLGTPRQFVDTIHVSIQD